MNYVYLIYKNKIYFMTQAEQLPKNIDKILEKVYELKSKTFFTPPVAVIDIKPMLLTKRQIAKKIILVSAGVISDIGQAVPAIEGAVQSTITSANQLGADIPNENSSIQSNYDVQFALNASQMIGKAMTPEAAHFIVYGKFKRDANGRLIDNEILDPDCVFTKLAMPDTHPTMSEIQIKINNVTKFLRMLGIKQQDLLDAIAQSMIAIPASITAIASAVAILPPGAGIPVAFSAFQGLIANIMSLVSKVSDVTIDMEYLNYLPLLVEAQKLDSVLGIVNAQLIAIHTILSTIDNITKIIPSVPTPPGVGDTPGDPVTVEATANPGRVIIGSPQDVKLSAKASNGSWEFNYTWYGPGGFKSTEQNVIIIGGPVATTTYQVKAVDKKDASNSATSEITIFVEQ